MDDVFTKIYISFKKIISLPQSNFMPKSLMIERSSVWIVKIEPCATLNVTVLLCLLRVEFAITFPSSRTVTRPSLLQLPNSSVAFPWPQKDVAIEEGDHCVIIHLCLSIVSKWFRQDCWLKARRPFPLIFSRFQPLSSILLVEVKSVIPASAQAAVRP